MCTNELCVKPCCARSDPCCMGQCGRLRGLALRRPCCGGWLYIYFVLVVCMFLTGIGFLIALSVDGRKANVDAFNGAVSAWPPIASTFSGLRVSISGDGAGGSLLLPANTAPDAYPDAAGLTLPTVAMHYQANALPTAPLAARAYANGAMASVVVNISGTLSPWTIPLFTKTSSTENGRQKERYYRLQALCFTANANNQATGGCAPGDGWVPQLMTSCGSSDFVNFQGITIDVRQENDPYVKAMRVTKGTLQFGVSQDVKIIVGAVLTALGLLLHLGTCACIRGPAAPSPQHTYILGAPLEPGSQLAIGGPPEAGAAGAYYPTPDMQKQQGLAQGPHAGYFAQPQHAPYQPYQPYQQQGGPAPSAPPMLAYEPYKASGV